MIIRRNRHISTDYSLNFLVVIPSIFINIQALSKNIKTDKFNEYQK